MKKGFSMVELVLIVCALGILTSIATASFGKFIVAKAQNDIVKSLVAHLEKQKSDALEGKDGSSYGIKLNPDSYVLFKGVAYSATSVHNQAVKIDPEFSIGVTASNSSGSIYFSKLTGKANEPATITISHIDNKISPRMVIIDASGTISNFE